MTGVEIGLLSLVAILVLIQIGLHVGISLMLVSFIGVVAIKGHTAVAGAFLTLAALDSVAKYSFGVIPLFVLMGMLIDLSGLGRDVFQVARQLFRRLTGGLGIATVFANAIFAAVNGTSIASASVFTRLAVPELLAAGYSRQFSVGVVAGSSVLGMLIPPSLLLILYGIVAEQSIGALFTAGIVPGIVLAVLFTLTILILARFFPRFVTADGSGRLPFPEDDHMGVLELARKSAPALILILIVLGGIYGGVFTPTEAGGTGALAALILTALRRRLTFQSFWRVLVETGRVTSAITFLIIAAHMYSRMLALSGLPSRIGMFVETNGFGLAATLAIYLILVLILGAILDSASIMLITLPLFLPVMAHFGVDLIWFGVLTIVAVEVGLLTPPLGIACFVVKANLHDIDITLGEIFAGAFPFVLAMLVLIALMLGFPSMVFLL